MNTIKFLNYSVVEVRPLSELQSFNSHKKMRVFLKKGVECPCCGLQAKYIVRGKAKCGGNHWILCAEDYYPFNIDHIIPRSKGGKNGIDNLQPMCYKCNSEKGSRVEVSIPTVKPTQTTTSSKKLKIKLCYYKEKVHSNTNLYRRNRHGNIKFLGKFLDFSINPHTNEMCVRVQENLDSYYSLNKVIVKVSSSL